MKSLKTDGVQLRNAVPFFFANEHKRTRLSVGGAFPLPRRNELWPGVKT